MAYYRPPQRAGAYHRVFRQLAGAGAQFGVGERIQESGVADGQGWLVEGPGYVLGPAQVHCGLAAQARVYLGQESGGDADPVYAPHIDGSREAGQVGHGPAAGRDYKGIAREALVKKERAELAGLLQRLGL